MKQYTKIHAPHFDRTNWQRPRTTKRYVHPPKSERMFTLWAEGKIIFGDVYDGTEFPVEQNKSGHEYYNLLVSGELWMLHGADRQEFDFHEVENIITPDGVPVHGIKYQLGQVEVLEETFCNTERKTSAYIKVRLTNTGDTKVAQQISFMLRTGLEKDMLIGGSDQYNDYQYDIKLHREKLAPTWEATSTGWTDGERVLTLLHSDVVPAWDKNDGMMDFVCELGAKESTEIVFLFNKGEDAGTDYEAEKAKVKAFWEKEFTRLNRIPDSWRENEETYKIVRCFTAQLLQCFAYPVGRDYLLWRQGGMQRPIWPSEVHVSFEALAKIGDFSDYLEAALDTYFTVMQRPDGEIVNIGIYWANVTGGCLYSFGHYCMNTGERGKKYYAKRREEAYQAFQWMKNIRATTIGSKELAEGLFPPKKACDWTQQFQAWQITDTYNIFGLQAYTKAAELFEKEYLQEIQNELAGYVEAMRRYVSPFVEEAKDSDELYIPLCPVGNDDQLVEQLYPMLHACDFITCGAIENGENAYKIRNALVNAGRSNGGLYGRMICSWSKRHMWYLSTPDFGWFNVWKELGEREKMEEILRDQLTYTMTTEYTMQERFMEEHPYFSPWSPNNSAMGRTLLMMLDLENK